MQVTSASAVSLTRIQVVYDTAYVGSSVTAINQWTIVSPDGLIPSVHTISTPNSTTVFLDVHPGLSAGAIYTVGNAFVKDAGSNFASPSTGVFSVSGSLYTAIAGYPLGMLESLTLAIGEQIQEVYQQPITKLARDFTTTDTTMFLETCLGLPDRGAVFLKGVRYTYKSRTDGALLDVLAEDLVLLTRAAGLEVSVDVRSVEPR